MNDQVTSETPTIYLDLNGCARCESDGHDQMVFTKLTNSVTSDNPSVPYTHWTMCPDTHEPILMQVFPNDGAEG